MYRTAKNPAAGSTRGTLEQAQQATQDRRALSMSLREQRPRRANGLSSQPVPVLGCGFRVDVEGATTEGRCTKCSVMQMIGHGVVCR